MSSPKKKNRPEPEFITKDDFLRLSREAQFESLQRRRRAATERRIRKQQLLLCWFCIALVSLLILAQGYGWGGFRLEMGAFGTAIAGLFTPIVPFMTRRR